MYALTPADAELGLEQLGIAEVIRLIAFCEGAVVALSPHVSLVPVALVAKAARHTLDGRRAWNSRHDTLPAHVRAVATELIGEFVRNAITARVPPGSNDDAKLHPAQVGDARGLELARSAGERMMVIRRHDPTMLPPAALLRARIRAWLAAVVAGNGVAPGVVTSPVDDSTQRATSAFEAAHER